jgi:predicted alpha/beta-hydrolase family hydrolase
MRTWLETALKIAVMGATMCSGIIVVKYNVPFGDERHEEERGSRQSQEKLDRAA